MQPPEVTCRLGACWPWRGAIAGETGLFKNTPIECFTRSLEMTTRQGRWVHVQTWAHSKVQHGPGEARLAWVCSVGCVNCAPERGRDLNISPKMAYGVLECELLCYRMTCL